MSIDHLLSRLERVRKTGRAEWVAACPAHHSKSKSSLTVSETADGRVLIHDFGGCTPTEVLDAVGLDFSDLFPECDHDDAGRAKGWRTAGYKDSRRDKVSIAPRTALVAIAYDATEAAVLVADAADGRTEAGAVRMRLWELAGRITSALQVSGVHRG